MADPAVSAVLQALQAQRHGDAVALARERLADQPADGETWFLLGIAQRALGDPATAAESYRRALVTHADHADVWFNLGNALSDAGRPEEALQAYREAAARDPGNVPAWQRVLELARGAGDAAIALEAAASLAARNPADLDAAAAWLRALREAGRHGEASSLFHRRLPDALGHAGFLLEGAHTLERAGDHRALAALFQRLDGLLPGNAVVKFQLGLNRLRSADNRGALEALQEAEALGLGDRALLVNLGTALARLERAEEALRYLERAAPDFATDPSAFVFAFALRQKLCDWRDHEALPRTLLAPALAQDGNGYPALPFPFTAFPGPIDEAAQLAIARRFAAWVARGIEPYPAHPWTGRHDRLRVGYLSADFHDHATAHLVLGMFKRHDRSRFEVFAYSCGPEDGSGYRARIRAEAEHFVDLAPLSDRDAAARIHADEIDVLVDLKGYTREARTAILAYRPAPVQVAWLGYPGSMGAPFIDWALVDPVVVPPGQREYYSERLLYMPHCYQVNDDEQPVAAQTPSRTALGLPEHGVVFCSFCAHYKIDPAAFDAWMRILKAVPGSVLWLIDGYPAARENLRREAHARGVDPARLHFAPRLRKDEHLARHRAADLFLDTFAYNAHTTMSDALWAGLPAITVPGRTFATRVGASLLQAAGMPECVAADTEGYVALAVELARDPARRAALARRLAETRHAVPLFDTAGFVRDWEARIEEICAPVQSGIPGADSARAPGAAAREAARAAHEAALPAVIAALDREDAPLAAERAEEILEAGCDRSDAWNVHAVALRRAGRTALAELCYRRGLGLKPDFADMAGNYANLLREDGRLDAALPLYREAVRLAPGSRGAWSNLAVALGAAARPQEQLDALCRAEALEPGNADTHWDKALTLLMLHRVREGLEEYEWRHARGQPPRRSYPQPEWRGEPLQGRRVFLHWEQGYGDVIQFLRFVPLVSARGGQVVMEVQPGLGSLAAGVPGVVEVVEAGAAAPGAAAPVTRLPDFDCWASLLSVPRILGIDEHSLPVQTPYLAAPASKRAQWTARLGAHRRPRVGLVWAGNPSVKNDRLRSPRLAPLLPLLALPGIDWVLLQQGDGRRDLQGLQLPAGTVDAGADAKDFADTAAAMECLDLVISSDTSTAHLAAALGVPAWVLLQHASDWRWGLGTSSPWYPRARLFRQPAPSDWDSVVADVGRELEKRFAPATGRRGAGSGAKASRKSPRHATAVARASKDGALADAPRQDGPTPLLVEAFSLYQRKRLRLARMAARAALTQTPLRADGWCLLGVVERGLGDAAGAERAYRRAVALLPAYADAWFNLGNLLRGARRLEEARDAYARVAQLQPGHHQALSLLSDVHRELRDLAQAEHCARAALARAPEFAEAWGHLGNVLNDLEQFDEAAACYERALRLPDCPPETHYNKGVALQRARQVEAAIGCYRTILSGKPGEVQAHYNLATSLLTLGRFAEGFREYEWRLAKPDLKPRRYAQPEWKGEPLAGRRVLLYWEQGCGDTLQFLRFAPLVAARGGRVILEVQAGLRALAATVPGVEAVIEAGETPPPFDTHAPLLSAPARLGLEHPAPASPLADAQAGPATAAGGVALPYLRVPSERIGAWRARLGPRDGSLRVGLVWAGNPQVANDRVRSPRLAPLHPLFHVPGITWCLLQQGDGRRDLEPALPPGRVLDLAPHARDFADTAAAMGELDLMISSDTSTAHLAAALGVPTWVLLHYAADWRWMEGDATAWYPGLRIFRQQEPGAWPETVDRLCVALAALASSLRPAAAESSTRSLETA